MSGKLLIWLGVGLSVLGLLMIYAPGLVNWFGKLPGDIRIQNENSSIFIPLTSMFVVSAILTVIVNLFFRG
jgi:membrane protein implicated in regulation of membrane protease activity